MSHLDSGPSNASQMWHRAGTNLPFWALTKLQMHEGNKELLLFWSLGALSFGVVCYMAIEIWDNSSPHGFHNHPISGTNNIFGSYLQMRTLRSKDLRVRSQRKHSWRADPGFKPRSISKPRLPGALLCPALVQLHTCCYHLLRPWVTNHHGLLQVWCLQASIWTWVHLSIFI